LYKSKQIGYASKLFLTSSKITSFLLQQPSLDISVHQGFKQKIN